jgi:hypothetical protein
MTGPAPTGMAPIRASENTRFCLGLSCEQAGSGSGQPACGYCKGDVT